MICLSDAPGERRRPALSCQGGQEGGKWLMLRAMELLCAVGSKTVPATLAIERVIG